MQIMNYQNHNAKEIAKRIKMFMEGAEKDKHLDPVQKESALIDRWLSENGELVKRHWRKGGAEWDNQRLVYKQLLIALAYMGYSTAAVKLVDICNLEYEAATSEEEKQRAKEESNFWETVSFLGMDEPGEPVNRWHALCILKGIGCDADPERVKSYYENLVFGRYEKMDEGQRRRIALMREGKTTAKMTPYRIAIIDAVVAGDRAAYSKAYAAAACDRMNEEIERATVLFGIANHVKIKTEEP